MPICAGRLNDDNRMLSPCHERAEECSCAPVRRDERQGFCSAARYRLVLRLEGVPATSTLRRSERGCRRAFQAVPCARFRKGRRRCRRTLPLAGVEATGPIQRRQAARSAHNGLDIRRSSNGGAGPDRIRPDDCVDQRVANKSHTLPVNTRGAPARPAQHRDAVGRGEELPSMRGH